MRSPYLTVFQTVAVLEPGSYFGGGARVLGEGELQSCMKVRGPLALGVRVQKLSMNLRVLCAVSRVVYCIT